ncbi:MAG: TonB-dependent receptor [Ferruginibacter sp.]|nr:TonB-dependent receptor [Ferruginibacter sp.]
MTLKLMIWLIFSSLAINAFAQAPAFRKPAAANGHFFGKLLENGTGKPVADASVQLIDRDSSGRKKDKILSTLLSDRKGEFSIEEVPVNGNFFLRVSAVGYAALEINIRFDMGTDKDLGNIRLNTDPKQLQAVTVSASRSLLQLNLDKKVYNVEKDLSVTGGTAVDVMKNVPTVNVDVDGNVTMRNAAPQIFIDGRVTTLTLDQIPADQIASVEIISNPSAKYDASGGGAGILNIILKKNRKSGYNGNVRASIDSRARPSFGGDFNFKQNKVNFFAAGQVGYRKSISEVNTRRTDFLSNGTANYAQANQPVNKGVFGFGRVGMDYLLDNRNTFTISTNLMKGHFRVEDAINSVRDTTRTSGYFKESGLRMLNADARFDNYGGSLAFKHNFSRPGKEITADANFNYSENSNTSDYSSKLWDDNNNMKPAPESERAIGGGTSRNMTFQTDFSNPFSKTQKIEFGLRTNIRNNSSWNDNFRQNAQTGNYYILPLIGVRYNYQDQVHAGYITYSQQWNKLSYQVGARMESSSYTGNLVSKSQRFSNNYPASFFPSLFIGYQLKDRQDMQLNFSRKINRPNFFQLIPFVDFSDSLNLSVGNPGLRPEFTHLAEIVYSLQYGKGNAFLASIYGKKTDNLITRYQYIDSLINPAKPARYTTFRNADHSFTTGLELTSKQKITSFWDLSSNVNIYHVVIEPGALAGTSRTANWSWFGKLNNSFKLPKNFSLQLTADYQAKTIVPASSPGNRGGGGGGGMMFGGGAQITSQGYLKPIYGADLSLKKDFLKNNAASLTIQFSDIFRSRLYASYVEGADFIQDNSRRRDPQIVRLNFNWRFGKFDVDLFKRKSQKADMENIQTMPQ